MKKKVGEIIIYGVRHGSRWTYIRSYTWGTSVLHCDGCSYYHNHNTRTAECYGWDEEGYAVTHQHKQRSRMAEMLRYFRKNHASCDSNGYYLS